MEAARGPSFRWRTTYLRSHVQFPIFTCGVRNPKCPGFAEKKNRSRTRDLPFTYRTTQSYLQKCPTGTLTASLSIQYFTPNNYHPTQPPTKNTSRPPFKLTRKIIRSGILVLLPGGGKKGRGRVESLSGIYGGLRGRLRRLRYEGECRETGIMKFRSKKR